MVSNTFSHILNQLNVQEKIYRLHVCINVHAYVRGYSLTFKLIHTHVLKTRGKNKERQKSFKYP